MLAQTARLMDGGQPRFLDFARLAADDGCPHARRFVAMVDRYGEEQRKLPPLDDICQMAKVSPVALLQDVVAAAFRVQSAVADLVASAAHPMIVETAVKSAKIIQSEIGFRDRQLLLQHQRFAPVAKSAVINVNAQANANAAAGAAAGSGVPSFLDDAEGATTPRKVVQQRLIEGVPPVDPLREFRTVVPRIKPQPVSELASEPDPVPVYGAVAGDDE